jgi:hypothetical protein
MNSITSQINVATTAIVNPYKEFFENQHKQILKDLEKLRDGTENTEKEILGYKKLCEELMKKSLNNL